MKGLVKRIIGLSSLGLMTALASQAYAAGYKAEFQSPSVLADAGEAAVVEDAGTNWYNSAGLVYIPAQVVLGVMDVYQQTKFSGSQFAPSPFGPAFNYSATGKASSYPNVMLPLIHVNLPLSERMSFGYSIVPAWGLDEAYGNYNFARYDVTRIHSKTIDIAPSLSFRFNDHWSLGIGPDFHYFSLSSNSNALTEGPAGFGGTTGDSISRFSAERWGTGVHAGILFRLDDKTRFGLNYRSKIVNALHGHSDFVINGGGGTVIENNKFRVTIPMPPVTTFSAYRDIDQRWAIMGTISYEQWSVQRGLNGQNYQTPTGVVNVLLPQNMHNVFDFSIGTHYKYNDKWMLRGSLKYVGCPTINAFRDLNNPDDTKYGINVGARYQMSKKVALDMMYGHVFTKAERINGFNPATGATTQGVVHTGIDVAGIQVVWNI